MGSSLRKDWADYGNSSEDDIVLGVPKVKRHQSRDLYEADEEFPDLVAGLDIGSDSEVTEVTRSSETYFSSEYEEESEQEDEIIPYDMNSLPEHACKYCGIHDPGCVARCTCCNRWFCNGKGTSNAGSHMVQHLVRAKHREVALHADSAVGDAVLECYHCGNKNIFLLGFIPAKADTVVVLLCRQPCASGAGSAKDATWDLENWMPLINQRTLLNWLVGTPSELEQLRARSVTSEQIVKLEELWKTKPEADLKDLDSVPAPEQVIAHVQLRYESAYEYHSIMAPLVALEAEQDKAAKEAQRQDSINIRWDIGLNMKRIAWFILPTNADADFRVAAGDEVQIKHAASKWKAAGNIIKTPSSSSEEIAVEIKHGRNSPAESNGYSVEFVWKATPYERMTMALKMLANNDRHLEPAILNELLGQGLDTPDLSIVLPKKISAPGLPELNHSQAQAVRYVLARPLSLIQGPPGTGKTVTSATIVYHLAQMNKGPILVCAPSNVAVDHLTEKIHQSGLRVVRIAAKWREDVDTSVSFLTLHSQLLNYEACPELQKFARLKAELGELSAKDERKYLDLKFRAERNILKAAQVVCTTAIGAGDRRLAGFKFSAVLLDEATQAVEPEALIPLVHRPRQVILVGDHRQLGPVVLCKKAVKAGFNQSLFERLITLGLRPVRLQVQYRMHPCLAEFPSNMFYDGSLQNGITAGERLRKGIDFPWPNPEMPMIFLSCIGTEEISSSGTSFLNRVEASNCEKIVTRFLKAAILPSQIGVITPYDGQRAYIQHYMQTSGSLRKELYTEVEVASVDAFQGREKDYIILSCVRSNDAQNIGFLSDARRLNVALTRARYGLIILGNPRALSRNLLWHHLISHFKEQGLLMEGTLGNLHPSLLQLARPRPLKFSDSIKPNNPAPKTLNFPTNSAAFINMDTISQSGFDTISLASLSQISQYSKPKTSRYFAIDEE
jgi:regulator of nonsense transcripts 1